MTIRWAATLALISVEEQTTPSTILVVEDEPAIQELVGLNLRQAGHIPLMALSAEQALDLLNSTQPDLILLDWQLPGISGIEFSRHVKSNERTCGVPIIMLTARSDEQDKIAGLNSGATDYIFKPFSPRDLISRVNAVLLGKTQKHGNTPSLTSKIQLDFDTYCVNARGLSIKLGPTEFRLLHFFMTHPELVYSRAQLLTQVWAWSGLKAIDEISVDEYVQHLRLALQPSGYNHLIQTVQNVGYRWSASCSNRT